MAAKKRSVPSGHNLQKKKFVKCNQKLRDKHKASDLIGKHGTANHFEYGPDPQKPKSKNFGKMKVLHKLCSNDMNGDDEFKEFIDDNIEFNFCMLAKSKESRCYKLGEYVFDMKYSFNLSEQILKVLTSHQLPSLFEDAMVSHLITGNNKECIFMVNHLKLYIRTITQNSLSSEMEARQNSNRVSYGPAILIEITPNVLMRIKCSIIGVGYYDLPTHSAQNCSPEGCIHRIIHIHEDYLKDVYIDFGFKKLDNDLIANDRVVLKLISDKLKQHYNGAVTLMDINTRLVSPPAFNHNYYGGYHHGAQPSHLNRYDPMAAMGANLNYNSNANVNLK